MKKTEKNLRFHVFKATRIGFEEESDLIAIDAQKYTKEEAAKKFHPYFGLSIDGFSYIGYDYNGTHYERFYYVGEYTAIDFTKKHKKKRNRKASELE